MPPALSVLTGVSLAVLWIGIAACAVRKANRKAARSALGVVPERNRNAAGITNSCVWHAETRGGMLVTWNSVLSGRESGNPVSFQTELKRSGDFIYRIDVPAGSVVSNFVTGAQHAGGGETADIGDALAGPLKLELRWKSIADLELSDPDCDGDGVSNRDEVLFYETDPSQSDSDLDGISDGTEVADGSDPLDPDENLDGVPDGLTRAEWLSNPLWGAVSGCTNLVLTIEGTNLTSNAAVCINGLLTVPVTNETTVIELDVPEGEKIAYSVMCTGGAMIRLTAERPDCPTSAVWTPECSECFGSFVSSESGFIAIPKLKLIDVCDGSPANRNRCLHNGETGLEIEAVVEPVECGITIEGIVLDGLEQMDNGHLRLPVGDVTGESASGSAHLYRLPYDLDADALAHRCAGVGLYCCGCGTPDERTVEIILGGLVDLDGNHYVCRHSANPPGRPTIQGWVRLTKPAPFPVHAELVGHKVRFMPGIVERWLVDLPSDGSWEEFCLSGQDASDALNDARVDVCTGNGDGGALGSVNLTVLWVDEISMRNEQNAPFSAENHSIAKPHPPLLGAQTTTNYKNEYSIGQSVELIGHVSPVNSKCDVTLVRDYIDRLFVAVYPNGTHITNIVNINEERKSVVNDQTYSEYQDVDPDPDGLIFDFDTPGFRWNKDTSYTSNMVMYVRANFLQYATMDGVRCSNDFAWHASVTSIATGNAGTNAYIRFDRPGHPCDNASGYGHIAISTE